MRTWWLIGIVIAAACRGEAPRPAVPASTATAPATRARAGQADRPSDALAHARALELGDGVARDYAAAVAVYRDACGDGRGDASACGAVIRAVMFARGADQDRAAAERLANQVCSARRDAFGCMMTELFARSERDIPEPLRGTVFDVIEHMAPCDRAHMSECFATMAGRALDLGDSSAASHRQAERDLRLCRVGIAEACGDIVDGARYGGSMTGAAGEAAQRLQAACDAGEAYACSLAPDRKPVPPGELCAAHDYEACAEAGCAGDPAARQLAADHHVDTTGCGRFVPDGGSHHERW